MVCTDPDVALLGAADPHPERNHADLGAGELYEEIERNPPAIIARKLLVEQFIAANWTDSVRASVEELYKLNGNDQQIINWHSTFCDNIEVTNTSEIINTDDNEDALGQNIAQTKIIGLGCSVKPALLPQDKDELAVEQANLISSYQAFRSQARLLLKNMRLVQSLKIHDDLNQMDQCRYNEVEALANGRIKSVLQNTETVSSLPTKATYTPPSARAIATKMKADPADAFKIVMDDLEAMIPWLKTIWQGSTMSNEDVLRDLILKRVRMMQSALPAVLQLHAQTAFMHLEHEQLKRIYMNADTMYGDTVAEISRERFLATEDNYAWDMEELAAAIQANKGIMRNPLSKFMFTAADIKSILQHPLGCELAALEVAQSQMRKGVRLETIKRMREMAKILLVDMDDAAKNSRNAVE